MSIPEQEKMKWMEKIPEQEKMKWMEKDMEVVRNKIETKKKELKHYESIQKQQEQQLANTVHAKFKPELKNLLYHERLDLYNICKAYSRETLELAIRMKDELSRFSYRAFEQACLEDTDPLKKHSD